MIREILFKNLSSVDRKRKLFSSCVISRKEGYITTTQRKYTYLIRKISQHGQGLFPTQIFIHNERNAKKQATKFNCLLKGSFYANGRGGLFLIRYAHSLEINHRYQSLKHP